MIANDIGMEKLNLTSTIGFAGKVPGGLLVHPDEKHIVYPLGNTIVVKNLSTHLQRFLSGHNDNVSCVTISKTGYYIASGQQTHMGFKAEVIIWNYQEMQINCRLLLHKVNVEAIAFSPNEKFLATLGGQDDGSVVLWDIAKKEAVCGAAAAVLSAGVTHCVAFASINNNVFVTGGNKTLRVWELDIEKRIIQPTDCSLGHLKRIVQCITVSDDDQYMYCGTTSGDILQINMKTKLLSQYGPLKDKFSLGILSILLKDNEFLIGAGDGTISLVKVDSFKRVRSIKVDGEITSLTLFGQTQFFAGTSFSQIYQIKFEDFSYQVISTCHYAKVLDISFPKNYSRLFATCSINDIRVWNAETSKELLRIVIPNMTCNAIEFTPDGKSIISAWDDGKIRAFTPETGKLKFSIHDAHNKGVTALMSTSDSKRIVSGGGEGQVRVWDIKVNEYKMVQAMKEHKGTVTSVKIRSNDSQCITSSIDGTCIIWDLVRFVRHQIIFANSMFKVVCYRPDECQILTAGTDHKISCWETYDGSPIRELEGTKSGSINGLDISPDGFYFVTGGEDKLIKVWRYNEGEITHIGFGHCGEITRLKICPLQKHIVSVSTDGAILRWKFPYEMTKTS
ncbi:cilia- and flagella-associated protein 52 isoform X1 [Hydra vulgaris]|uniref:cilia- and flagella-associated protein 52 isoform X1 n=1 Tax=Hydra vulgaris TaxID=6087 RepID=UPI0006414BD3|nr:cilia- and flagella-associated protein 52 [Hydra vulgaris]